MSLKDLNAKMKAVKSETGEKTANTFTKEEIVNKESSEDSIAGGAKSLRVRSAEDAGSGVEVVRPVKALNPMKKVERAMVSIASRMTEQDLEDDIRVVREARSATHRFWDMGTKKWVETPDHRMRLAAAAFSRSYAEGLPVARQIQLTADLGGMDDALEKLKASPTAMAAVLAMFGDKVAGIVGEPKTDFP